MTSIIKVNNLQNQCGANTINKCGTAITVGASGDTTTVAGNILKSNALQAADGGNLVNQCGTTITLGASGDTVTLAAGASQSGFGQTYSAVSWDTTPKTGLFTAVSGVGYFCNTTSAPFTVTLPAGTAGDVIAFADYTRTFQTNNLTITPNGSEKVGGVAANFVAQTEGQSITLVYVDATEGWINTMDSTGQAGLTPAFITATGGTITTVCTDYKVHTFTGPGTFCVSAVGNPLGSGSVDYMVVAGGGGGGTDQGGGAGAGGYRESPGTASGCYSVSPIAGGTAITATVTSYPIVVGSGGTGASLSPALATQGSNSSALGIISTGGGIGGTYPISPSTNLNGGPGGSGGGGGGNCSVSPGGTGNTPPTSPAQGTNGGTAPAGPAFYGSSGGGATGAGASNCTGGTGATSSITNSSVNRAGGGGGRSTPTPAGVPYGGGAFSAPTGPSSNGTVNTGGAGGSAGAGSPGCSGGAGGSGVVVIRYKFQ